MAKKNKPVKPTKAKASTKSTLGTTALGVAKSALGLGGTTKSKGTGKRRKKSALFYAREIQRLKLKKRYEKIRIGA